MCRPFHPTLAIIFESSRGGLTVVETATNTTRDTLVRATAADGQIRCMAAVTTRTVAEAARRHGVSPTVAAALGRTLTGALLLGAGVKEFDRLTLQIDSDGPVGGITAEANARGEARGYVRN